MRRAMAMTREPMLTRVTAGKRAPRVVHALEPTHVATVVTGQRDDDTHKYPQACPRAKRLTRFNAVVFVPWRVSAFGII